MKQSWKKNAAVFLACQAISLFGSSLVQYAITWHITLTTQSGLYTTAAIVCGFLPMFFLSPLGGVWADRYNRKVLIMVSDACIALCTLALAVLFAMGHRDIWLLLVAMALRGVGGAVQQPCVAAILPDLVPEDKLTRVNGINSSLQSAITLLSPMLSGAMMTVVGIQYILLVDVATAALAIGVMLALLRLPTKPRERVAGEESYLGGLREGLRYIAAQPYLRSFFLFLTIFFLMSAPVGFLTPLQTVRVFGDDVWRLSAVELTFSIGMMVGGLVMAAWGGFANRVHTMVLGGVGLGACTFLLGLPRYFGLYLLLMALWGLSMPLFNTPATVLLQERVDPRYMGRVFGVLTMISSSMMPLGMLVFGPLADTIPIEWMLLGTGVFYVASSLLLLKNRPLLEAGQRKAA